jgi:hypothetical protein
MKKTKYRVYANYGKGDTNQFGFSKKKDALSMARHCRKHKGLKWISIKKLG